MNQAQLHALRAELAKEIRTAENVKEMMLVRIKKIYKRCDINDPSTESNFEELNCRRDRYRYWEQRRKKLEGLQKGVKKMLKQQVKDNRKVLDAQKSQGEV